MVEVHRIPRGAQVRESDENIVVDEEPEYTDLVRVFVNGVVEFRNQWRGSRKERRKPPGRNPRSRE